MNQLADKTMQPAIYTREQAVHLFETNNSSEAMLYRKARAHEIRTYLPPGRKRGVTFDKGDVDSVLSTLSPSYKPDAYNLALFAPNHQDGLATQKETAVTDWVRKENVPYLYIFDVKKQGMEDAIDPKAFPGWLSKNPYLSRILHKENDPTQIYGALTILPLQEETILRLLKQEISERDLTPHDILVYKSGRNFTGYIKSLAIDEQYRHEASNLVSSMFSIWCDFFPGSQMKKLYARARTEEADKLLSRFYFAPRYDLSTQPNRTDVYELDLQRPNRSPLMQRFQHLMKTAQHPSPAEDITASIQTFLPEDHDLDSPTFEKAALEDLAATHQIDLELYPPSESNPLEVRQQRYHINPDGFYVLRHHGEVVAHACFLPMEPAALQRLLDGVPGRVPLDAVQRWEVGKPLYVYVVMASVKKGADPARRYGPRLIAGIVRVFEQLGSQGVDIIRVTARSRTPDGIRLCQGLGMVMEPIPGEEDRFRFALDMRSSQIKLARVYQTAHAEYQVKQMLRFGSGDR